MTVVKKKKQYIIQYGSSQQGAGSYLSTSSDSKHHGWGSFGTAGGGWVRVWETSPFPLDKDIAERAESRGYFDFPEAEGGRHPWKVVSEAAYTPENGGRWFSSRGGSSGAVWETEDWPRPHKSLASSSIKSHRDMSAKL